MSPRQRATALVALFAGVPAVVLGLVLGLTAGLIAGLVVFVVLAVGLGAWARFGGDRRALGSLPTRAADPVADARVLNLIEGLSVGAGVRQPRLLLVDTPGLNAMVAGTTPARATVVVTTGLLGELARIELEAVLAEELVLIRHQETVPATVLTATFGLGRRIGIPVDRDTRADTAAVTLTRYPPALAAALEKVQAKGAQVPGVAGPRRHLWLADPAGPDAGPQPGSPRPGDAAGGPLRGRVALVERIEALREL
jgi:Zn-dependent protease with chaperone function